MPLPNSRVIPAGWSAHHRPVVAATWTADVTIRPPGVTGAGDFDPETGETTGGTPHPAHYAGKARIQAKPITQGEDVVADQELSSYGYLVVVDLTESAATEVGHLVKVTAVDDNGDPTLVGRDLTVAAVTRGSLAWERDLLCIDDLG